MDEDLDRWLESVPLPPEFADGQDAQFGAALTGELDQITWSAAGHPGGYIPKMAAYFGELSISQVDIASLNEAGEDVRPGRVGSWVRIRDGVMDRGWYFPVEMELARARAHGQSSDANAQLGEWAQRHQLEVCSRLGRSLGKDRFTEIVVPLAGVSAAEQLEAAADAFRALHSPELPERVMAALRTAASEGLQMMFWLGDGSLTKIGVQVVQPAAELVRELGEQATQEQARIVSQFEGILEVEGPVAVECHYFGDKYGLERLYTPKIGPSSGPPRKRRDPKNLPS
jgi:hypothetical protein